MNQPTPIADPNAEKTILGATLLEPEACTDAVLTLSVNDFYTDSHRQIFSAIVRLSGDGKPVDFVTLGAELARVHALDSVGGYTYLGSLTEGIPRRLNIASYVRIVKDHAFARESLLLAERLTAGIRESGESPRAVLERSLEEFRELSEEGGDGDLERVGAFLERQGSPEDVFEQMATVGGVKLGWRDLDEMIGGLQGGELVIIAARPSMGKTAAAVNACYQTSVMQGLTTVFFSLEQKREAMIRRMLASASRVDYKAIREGDIGYHDKALILERRQMIADAQLYIDDRSGMTVSRMRSKCARLKRKTGKMDLVIIDQLSKISAADVAHKGMDLRQIIGKQTAGMKLMAQELNVPVICLCQLGREATKGSDLTPRLSHLKESGNIEEDADVVILLHRPEMYDRTDAEFRGKGQFIVAKNREGETGTIKMQYQAKIMRWEDNDAPEENQTSFNEYRGNW